MTTLYATPPDTALTSPDLGREEVFRSPMQQRLIERLHAARVQRGWSQRKLGIEMGLPPKTGSARINRYEQGRSAMSLDAIEQMAYALGVPWAYFFLDDANAAQSVGQGIAEHHEAAVA